MRSLLIILLVLIALIAGVIGGVFTNFWLFPTLAEVPVFQKYFELDPSGHTIVKLLEQKKEVISEDEAFFSAIDLSSPSLVTVIARDDDRARPAEFAGTGFFVSADGLVVTNKRLVSGADKTFQVIDQSNNAHPAVLVGRDPLSDLALLKVDGDNFPVSNLASSGAARIGQRVLVLGSKFGRDDNQVTIGNINSTNQGIFVRGAAENASRLEGVMEISAEIDGRNSGGPVLDYNGRVLGLAAEVSGASAPGYVIPITTIRQVVDRYMAGESLVRSTIGIYSQTVTPDLANLEKMPVAQGVVLRGGAGTLAATIGGPAYRAGLRDGDIITKINDTDIDPAQGFFTMLQEFSPGDEIKLTYWRQNEEKSLILTVGESK